MITNRNVGYTNRRSAVFKKTFRRIYEASTQQEKN